MEEKGRNEWKGEHFHSSLVFGRGKKIPFWIYFSRRVWGDLTLQTLKSDIQLSLCPAYSLFEKPEREGRKRRGGEGGNERGGGAKRKGKEREIKLDWFSRMKDCK